MAFLRIRELDQSFPNAGHMSFCRGCSVLSTVERYQRIAPFYDLLDLPFEHGRYRRIRRLLFQGLSGRLLDAGVGTGRNFPFYPPGSTVWESTSVPPCWHGQSGGENPRRLRLS